MVHGSHTVIELNIDRVNRLIELLRTFLLLVPPACLPRYLTLGGVYTILIAEHRRRSRHLVQIVVSRRPKGHRDVALSCWRRLSTR